MPDADRVRRVRAGVKAQRLAACQHVRAPICSQTRDRSEKLTQSALGGLPGFLQGMPARAVRGADQRGGGAAGQVP
eukprot:1707270-Rhodomonas_salina.1